MIEIVITKYIHFTINWLSTDTSVGILQEHYLDNKSGLKSFTYKKVTIN